MIFFNPQLTASAFNKPSSLSLQPLEDCVNPGYPRLDDQYKSGSVNAGKIDIQSNGALVLDENVLIGLDKGIINATGATYLQNQGLIKDIKNGNIYHSENYFKFLSGSLEENSGSLQLFNGETYLRERNLLIRYQLLEGNLDQNLRFQNANLSSCNDSSEGWEVIAKTIIINEESDRGHIKDLTLKVLDRQF